MGVLNLKSAKEIARDLGISAHAVEKHLRVARQKLGVSTSAEGARIYASRTGGSVFPHSQSSDLAAPRLYEGEWRSVPDRAVRPNFASLEDDNGALLPDRPLAPRQTLLTIFAVSIGSIIGLLLLVACAQGIRALVSG